MPTIAELRTQLANARAWEIEWKARGAPESEASGVLARVADAERALAEAIGGGDSNPVLAPEQDPWSDGFQGPTDGPVTKPSQLDRPQPHQDLPRPPRAPASAADAHASHVAKRREQRGKPPRAVSKEVINKETDARFWAQTHYKVGQKINPNIPADRAMVKAWMDIFHKVEAEAATGHLVTTWDHPEVAELIDTATQAREAAEHHMEEASTSTDPWAKTNAIESATAANKASQAAANKAASYQPPTISPQVAATAVRDAHAAARKPPPNVKIFPKGHPVNWRPSARPSNPVLATPNAPEAASSPDDPSPTASDNLALANAAGAPDRAADLHAQDAAKDQSGGLPRFPDQAPGGSKKSGLSLFQKIALGLGGLVAAGGVGYGIYRASSSSSPRSTPRRARPRRRAAPAAPSFPGMPGGVR